MSTNPLLSLLMHNSKLNPEELKLHLRDLIQKICLLGLWRAGFFEYASFYGGTALRMLYGLDRFSEDLDFSLLYGKPKPAPETYLGYVQRELEAWNILAEMAEYPKQDSSIESAFVKANTYQALLNLKVNSSDLGRLHRDEVCKVKFEIDTTPPCSYEDEFRYVLEPIPFAVRSMSLPDLFAGKMHALLARKWQNRVKGRDWFDFIWFIRNNIPLNLKHLEARLVQSGHWKEPGNLAIPDFKLMLAERISSIDFAKAKADVLPFISRADLLQNWSAELFSQISERLTFAI